MFESVDAFIRYHNEDNDFPFTGDQIEAIRVCWDARQAEVDAANARISELEGIDKVCDFQREGIEKMQADIDRLESSRDAAVAAAEYSLYKELESAVRTHLLANPGLKGDPFFALQHAFTVCRRKSPVESLQQKAKP